MPNTSIRVKPCVACRQRKIKCDLTKPACKQCQKAGWVCSGFPVQQDTIFQHETVASLQRYRPNSRISELSPPVEDRAIAFLTQNYVFSIGSGIGNHAHLPRLLERCDSRSLIRTVAVATGLSALANAGASSNWRSQAYLLYGTAVRQLQFDLSQPFIANTDQILASILLLATFEAITIPSLNSINTLRHHIFAAAQLVHDQSYMRFSEDPVISSSLSMQLYGAIIMVCHELQEPIPAVAEIWSIQIESCLPNDDIPLKDLGNIEKRLITARADLKEMINPPLLITKSILQPIDERLEIWRTSIPSSWAFKSYKRLPLDGIKTDDPISEYHVYPNLYSAVMWNAYRSYRLLIHETIMSALVSDSKDMIHLQPSIDIIALMTESICQSIPYCLLYKGPNNRLTQLLGPKDKWDPSEWSTFGALLIFWQLFSCGISTTNIKQRYWIICILKSIGTRLGMALAISMATTLESLNNLQGKG